MSGDQLIDAFLGRQQDLTAVERFSAHHDADDTTAHAGWYRSLLPASPPGPGEQYAFGVDLDSCTACKACVSACHSLNGLDDDESWRRVGMIHGSAGGTDTRQAVTSACHHCVDPACLQGCPVDAYDKNPITGIVAHLDDQCIGCGYCTWMCPYDVPVMNDRLGVVRKCDLCQSRLAVGEAPACVQACPNGAITVEVVSVDDVVAEIQAAGTLPAEADHLEADRARTRRDPVVRLVPHAPPSAITSPTTRYRSREPLSAPGPSEVAVPAHNHRPLVAMLVLTQAAVGGLVVALASSLVTDWSTDLRRVLFATVSGVGLAGLVGAITHLGRPLQAWRAVLGVGHSWLSREVVAFGVFAPATLAATAVAVAVPDQRGLASLIAWIAATIGVGAVGTSAALYAVTRRTWWSPRRTTADFAATMVAAGTALAAAMVGVFGDAGDAKLHGALAIATMTAAGASVAVRVLLHAVRSPDPAIAAGQALVEGPLRRTKRIALVATVGAGLAIPGLILAIDTDPGSLATSGLALCTLVGIVVAEVANRTLFFRAMVAPSMPGTHQ